MKSWKGLEEFLKSIEESEKCYKSVLSVFGRTITTCRSFEEFKQLLKNLIHSWKRIKKVWAPNSSVGQMGSSRKKSTFPFFFLYFSVLFDFENFYQSGKFDVMTFPHFLISFLYILLQFFHVRNINNVCLKN